MTTKARVILLSIVLLVAGGYMVFTSFKNDSGIQNAKNLSEMKESDLQADTYVKGSTSMVLDWYCNETEEKYGKEDEIFRWYLIPMDESQRSFIGVRVPKKLFEDYDQVMDDYWKYLEGEQLSLNYNLSFQGKLVQNKDDVAKYLKEYYEQIGDEGDDYSEMFLPYYIEIVLSDTNYSSRIIGFVMIGISALILLILFLVSAKDRKVVLNCQEVNPGNGNYGGLSPELRENGGADYTNELDQILKREDELIDKENTFRDNRDYNGK